MSEISAVSHSTVGRIEPVARGHERAPASAAASVARGEDRVELSDKARYMQSLREVPAIRSELVNRVKQEIASGTYDTTERFNEAFDAMIDDALELP